MFHNPEIFFWVELHPRKITQPTRGLFFFIAQCRNHESHHPDQTKPLPLEKQNVRKSTPFQTGLWGQKISTPFQKEIHPKLLQQFFLSSSTKPHSQLRWVLPTNGILFGGETLSAWRRAACLGIAYFWGKRGD